MSECQDEDNLEEEEPASELHAPDAAIGLRLDTWLSRLPGAPSRNRIQQLVKDGCVLVEGKKAKPSYVIEGSERVTVDWPGPEDDWPRPQNIPLNIVFHDDDVIVINKQPDLVIHPSGGRPDGTMVNGLLHRFPDLPGINGVRRPGIVHRLDRDTTGLMIVAKSERAMRSLARQFQEKSVRRSYLALVIGAPAWEHHTVDAAIGRDPVNRLKRAIDGGFPRSARSHFTVLLRTHSFTLIRCVLDTGRTHQIRIHLQHAGYPIVGDELYGGHANRCLERLDSREHELRRAFAIYRRPFLHSHSLEFQHPANDAQYSFTAGPPEDSRALLSLIFGEDAKEYFSDGQTIPPEPGRQSE